MKTRRFFALSLAAAAMTLTACQNEDIENVGDGIPVTFHITANTDGTRSVFGAKDGDAYPVVWTTNKQVAFSLNEGDFESFTPSVQNDGTNAEFDITFSNGGSVTDGTIYAFSPKGVYDSANPENNVPGFTGINSDHDDVYLNIPSVQTPLANSCDESAQALYASQSYNGSNTEINMTFHHAVAYGKMQIKNFTGTISKVDIVFPENVCGTSCLFYYAGDAGTIANTKINTITLNPDNVVDNVFWFACAPTTATTGDMKVIVTDDENKTYTKTINIASNPSKPLKFNQGRVSSFGVNMSGIGAEVDYVTLPWSWKGGSSTDFANVNGVTAVGFGTDYGESHTPYHMKWDNNDDYFIVKTNSSIGAIKIGVKMIGGNSNSSVLILGSSDGSDYNEIQTLTISGSQNSILELTTTTEFDPSFRYVKAVFTKGSNVGVGPIEITKPDTDPSLLASDINGVAAAGVTNAQADYTVKNFDDDVIVDSFTGCVTAASANSGKVVYSVAPNYKTTAEKGTIVIRSSSNNELTKTINVTQSKSTLNVSTTEITIPYNSTSQSFTLTTKEMGWNIDVNPETGMNLSVNESSGSANDDAQTVTINSTIEASTSEILTLGTIVVYRNGNTGDSQKKTIIVKKGKVPSSSGPIILFKESFGNNSNSARAWKDEYKEQSGISEVYSSASYTMINIKQGKNTTGATNSGINQTTQGVDAVFEFGPLNVSGYSNMTLSYKWKAASIGKTYFTNVYYKTSANGDYIEIPNSAVGATTFVDVSVDLPASASCPTLYLKIVFNTSNTQAIIDEVQLMGSAN